VFFFQMWDGKQRPSSSVVQDLPCAPWTHFLFAMLSLISHRLSLRTDLLSTLLPLMGLLKTDQPTKMLATVTAREAFGQDIPQQLA
jgi:hypothetical protein